MTTPPVVFYGNCQMQVLAQAYEIFAAPHTGERVLYVNAGGAHPDIARAGIVIDQITPMGDQAPIAGVPAGARRLRVPVVEGAFLWPFSGERHPDSLRRYPGYHPFSRELGDAWLLRAMARGTAPDAAVAQYLALDIGRAAHLDRRREIALDLQRAREADTAYRFAPLIEKHVRTEPLFRTPYHLGSRLARHMLLTLLDAIGAPPAARQAAALYATTSLFGGSDLPVHPGVAAHFGLDWAGPGTRYAFWRETMLNFEEWAHRFVRCEAYPEMDRAVDAVTRSLPGAPALLAAALAQLPDSPWGLRALAVLHLRANRFAEALAAIERAVALHPDLAGAHATLHDCLLGLGRTEDAIDALREEIRRQPFRIPHRMRLARHLMARGRGEEARAVLASVLALQPGHEQALRLSK